MAEISIVDIIHYMAHERLTKIELSQNNGITYCHRYVRDGGIKQLELRESSYTREQVEASQNQNQNPKEDMPDMEIE